jgi:hypothetical protein
LRYYHGIFLVRQRKTTIFLRTAVSEQKFELETPQIRSRSATDSTATFGENFCYKEEHKFLVGPEVLAAMTMKDTVFWVVMLCSLEKFRRFGEHVASIFRVNG